MLSLQVAATLSGGMIKRRGLEVRENTDFALLRLQTFSRTPDAISAVREKVDLPLPGPGTFTAHKCQCYWTGPGDWIVGVPPGEEARVSQRIRESAGNLLTVVTVITDSRVVLDVTGSDFRQVLARGSSVDFHADRFLPGACVCTRFAGIAAMVAAGVNGNGARLFCDRASADYLWNWLSAASVDL